MDIKTISRSHRSKRIIPPRDKFSFARRFPWGRIMCSRYIFSVILCKKTFTNSSSIFQQGYLKLIQLFEKRIFMTAWNWQSCGIFIHMYVINVSSLFLHIRKKTNNKFLLLFGINVSCIYINSSSCNSTKINYYI